MAKIFKIIGGGIGFKVRNYKNFQKFLTGKYFCWIKALKNVSLYTIYILVGLYPSEIDVCSLGGVIREFDFNNKVSFSVSRADSRVVGHFSYSDVTISDVDFVNYIVGCCSKCGVVGSYPQISKDAHYQLTNITRKDCIGYEAASGSLGKFSEKMVKNALIVPYSCTEAEQTSIRESIPNRFILFDLPGQRVSHPHLKFLTNYLDDNLMGLDVAGKIVKVIGPKFDKKEVEAFRDALNVHYCTKKPVYDDIPRKVSSIKTLNRKLRQNTDKIQVCTHQIEMLEVEQRKKPGSQYVHDIFAQIIKIVDERALYRYANEDLLEEIKALESYEDQKSNKICNVGAENCDEPCDVMFSMHSLYDIDLNELMANAVKVGAIEVYATVILPFGLLFVDAYQSPELGVTFQRDGKGFLMWHDGDMSNGYVHSKAKTIMALMRNSFINADNGNWSYEIVDSVAEICKLRFTRANKNMRIVRKLLPPKFDKYTLIMNPLDYFGSVTRRTPMLVETSKYESAIKMVKRSKSSKDIIENLYAHVQATFMKVVVGNTELQAGGFVTSDMEDSLVLAALIEGNVRKHLLGLAYKRSLNSGSGFSAILDRVWDEIKGCVYDIVPDWIVDAFTKTKAEIFLREKVSLQELKLDTSVELFVNVSKYFTALTGMGGNDNDNKEFRPLIEEVKNGFTHRIETINKSLEPKSEITKMAKAFSMLDVVSDKKISIKEEETENKKKIAMKMMVNTIEADKILKDEEFKRRKAKEDNVVYDPLVDFLNPGEDSGDEDEESDEESDDNNIDKNALVDSNDVKAVVQIPTVNIEEHDPRSTEHIEHKMDPLSEAALDFNSRRAKLIRENGGEYRMSPNQIEKAMEKFTRKGKVTNPILDLEIVKDELENLTSCYAVDASTCTQKILKGIKGNVLALLKKVRNSNIYEEVYEKNVEIINGYAGCGKTRKILKEFDPSVDSYVSPLSQILFEFSDKLKKEKREEMLMNKREDMLKTYEKLDSLRTNGGVLYVDESGKFSMGFILLILLSTRYEKYVFVGDCEQSGFYDVTGTASHLKYTDLVNEEDVTKFMYTFRFGPTVAAFNNVAFNYPVFSLKGTDTTIKYRDLDDFDSSVNGTNICITKTTKEYIIDDIGAQNCLTAVASQGITVPKVNLLLRPVDIKASVSFRSNGIVASTRAEEELNLYIDCVSKNTKQKKNFEILRENYAQVFDIVIPSVSDF